MKHLGLGEYAEQFKANHITGVNLLDLTDADMKQEFKIASLGHRKNLRKAIEQLNQIYRGGKDPEYIKNKIRSFYNKTFLRFKRTHPINSFGSNDGGGLNSLRKLYSGAYNSLQGVIQEDNDEAEVFSPPEMKVEKKRSGEAPNFKFDSNEEKADEDDHNHEALPRKMRDRKPSFASGSSRDSTPGEKKPRRKKSTMSKRSGSGRESQSHSREYDINRTSEIAIKEGGEILVRIQSPIKREEAESRPREERNLLGHYLLHNQYDSHDRRENIIANQNNISTPSHSYEGSSPTDSETSSSEEDSAKTLKCQLSKQSSTTPSPDLFQKGSPGLNQILLGTTGIGQIVHPMPQVQLGSELHQVEKANPSFVKNLFGAGENNMNELNRPLLRKNHSTPSEIRPKVIKNSKSTSPVLQPMQNDNELHLLKLPARQDDQSKRSEGGQAPVKKAIIPEDGAKVSRTSKKTALSNSILHQYCLNMHIPPHR